MRVMAGRRRKSRRDAMPSVEMHSTSFVISEGQDASFQCTKQRTKLVY